MRLIRTVAAPAVAATALITGVVAATPAFAKSDVTIAVSTHRAEVGHAVRITVTGDNDAQGRYTVRVQQPDGRIEPRTVRIGLNSRVRAQVLEGLKEGERVVTSEALANATPNEGGRRGPPPM